MNVIMSKHYKHFMQPKFSSAIKKCGANIFDLTKTTQ